MKAYFFIHATTGLVMVADARRGNEKEVVNVVLGRSYWDEDPRFKSKPGHDSILFPAKTFAKFLSRRGWYGETGNYYVYVGEV